MFCVHIQDRDFPALAPNGRHWNGWAESIGACLFLVSNAALAAEVYLAGSLLSAHVLRAQRGGVVDDDDEALIDDGFDTVDDDGSKWHIEYGQSQITASRFFFSNGAKSGFDMCFCYRIPAPFGAGGPSQNTVSNPE